MLGTIKRILKLDILHVQNLFEFTVVGRISIKLSYHYSIPGS
jgi:hypothetical protein